MFAKPIVFVVGAGASFELGFPLGLSLRKSIAADLTFRFDPLNQTSGSRELANLIRMTHPGDTNAYFEAAHLLSPAMEPFPSVDEALHHFAGNERVIQLGKLAIAMRIIGAERTSTLPPEQDHEAVAKFSWQTGWWLAEFLSMALSGTTLKDNRRLFENVTIVDFNYDRSPEHFLVHALLRNAARDEESAKEALLNLKILRPYGSIGPLPWQQKKREGVPYGELRVGSPNIGGAAANIRTFTEQNVDDQMRKDISSALDNAQA